MFRHRPFQLEFPWFPQQMESYLEVCLLDEVLLLRDMSAAQLQFP